MTSTSGSSSNSQTVLGRTGAALSFVHKKKSWQNLMDICKHKGWRWRQNLMDICKHEKREAGREWLEERGGMTENN